MLFNTKEDSNLLRLAEAATFLGVDKSTLNQWATRSNIPFVMVNGRRRYHKRALLDWMEAGCPSQQQIQQEDDDAVV